MPFIMMPTLQLPSPEAGIEFRHLNIHTQTLVCELMRRPLRIMTKTLINMAFAGAPPVSDTVA